MPDVLLIYQRKFMVITASAILIGLLLLIRSLQKNSFYLLHAGIVILGAYYIETHYFRVTPFAPKALLLFLVYQFVVINPVTYLAYFVDKRAAVRGEWRIPERNLHALEMLGGWSGALLAQKTLHHKNKKKSYQAEFAFVLIMQIGFIVAALQFLGIIHL